MTDKDAAAEADLFREVQAAFAGRFDLDQLIASSDIRALFLVRDSFLKRHVALRIQFAEGRQRAWFERETQLLASLDHPSMRAVYSAGVEGPWAYRISKFIEGESLAEAVARTPRTIPETVRLARDLMGVLEYAHSRDIVLRRIVPANVMLDLAGQAIITDLRFANRCLTFADADPEGEQFFAPETWHGHAGEPASDIYATAAILYFAMTGAPPDNNPNRIVSLRTLRRACPAALERVIMRGLRPDPHDRYFNAAEMAEDLFSELGDFETPTASPVVTRPSDDHEAWEKRLRRALGDEYELLKELGAGGFGSVYLVRDLRLEREVALKVLHPQLTSQPTVVERFRKESQLAAQLTHANIVQIHDTGSRGGLIWYTMAYVPGMNLSQKVGAEGPLSATQFFRVMQEALSALSHAHDRNVAHRDLKPENILLDSRDAAVRITDFGLAIALQTDRPGGPASHSGTPEFAAPEQLLGESVDHRADLFSIAAVAYFALTGRSPFGAGRPELIVARQAAGVFPGGQAGISDTLLRVLKKGMSRNPDDRFASAAEFAAALRSARRGGPFARLRAALFR